MLTDKQLIETIEQVAGVPNCDVEVRASRPDIVVYIDDLESITAYRQGFFVNHLGRHEADYMEFTTGTRSTDGRNIEWSGDWSFIDDCDLPAWVKDAYDRAFTAFMMIT